MKKHFSSSFAAVLLVAALLGPVPRLAAQADEEKAVMHVVHELFDGMREKDADKIRGVFAEGARLGGVGREGSVNYTTAEQFAMTIGGLEGSLDERIWDWEVQIDGNLAQVWTKYDILIGGNFSHCGVDAFQLLNLQGEWKIVHLADSRHTGPDCWRYPGNE